MSIEGLFYEDDSELACPLDSNAPACITFSLALHIPLVSQTGLHLFFFPPFSSLEGMLIVTSFIGSSRGLFEIRLKKLQIHKTQTGRSCTFVRIWGMKHSLMTHNLSWWLHDTEEKPHCPKKVELQVTILVLPESFYLQM